MAVTSILPGVPGVFAREALETGETPENEIDDLKQQLKMMEELFSKQQEQIKHMQESAARQQEQMQALRDRLEKIHTETVSVTREEVKEEVKHEVENYLAAEKAREATDLDIRRITALYTPDGEKYALSLETADGNYSLSFGGRLQFLYSFEDNDEDFEEADKNILDIRRARLFLGGNIYSEIFKYYIELGFDDFDAVVKNFYAYWTPFKVLNSKIGFFKVPFNRQGVTTSAHLLFPDRSIVSNTFTQDRDYGFDIYGYPFDGYLEYHAAIFQGAGEDPLEDDINNELMYVLNLRYNPFGKFNYYDETDYAYTETLKATIGASVAFNAKLDDEKLENTDSIAGVVDLGVKYRGISWNNEYHIRSDDPEDGGDSTESDGFFTQIGYFVLPKRLELAARYSYIDPNNDVSDDIQKAYRVGLNYYFRAHRSKIQSDFGIVTTERAGQDQQDNIFRLQYQVIF
ncbi:MAG: porin [wastewater metagenome]|nr:porin [Candidatus Loosdrechtia aerotolerans]